MKLYFTATGTVSVTDKDSVVECPFSHVILAQNSLDAEDKLLWYYINKSDNDPDTHYDVLEVSIFDFIF